MIKRVFFQYWLWLISILAIMLNITVIIFRVKVCIKESFSLHDGAIIHLAFSDMLYGIYLFIITIANTYFGQNYALSDRIWRNSPVCHLASALATLSVIMSCLCLTVITCIRHRSITNMEKDERLTSKMFSAKLFGGLWISCIMLVTSCFIQNTYIATDEGGQSTSVCLTLLSYTQGSVISLLQIVVVNTFLSIAILVMIIGYVRIGQYYHSVKSSVAKKPKKTGGGGIFTHIIILITSNVTCWVPAIVVSMLTLGGITVSTDVLTTVSVVILPINSVINPAIYTLASLVFLKKHIHQKVITN